jgi:hypothetical protein
MLDADGSRVTFDPASRVRPVLERDGLWTMLDGAGQELGLTAVNVAPPSGRTGTQAESAVAAWLGDAGPWTVVADRELTTPLARASAGSPVARMLLLILVGLVILETLLARLFSHATTTGEAASAAGDPGRLSIGAATAAGGVR